MAAHWEDNTHDWGDKKQIEDVPTDAAYDKKEKGHKETSNQSIGEVWHDVPLIDPEVTY
jgi:hypothetical protein